MRTVRELVCGLAGLFTLGVAGGLEKGLLTVGGAVLAWAGAAMVIGIVILTGRRVDNGH